MNKSKLTDRFLPWWICRWVVSSRDEISFSLANEFHVCISQDSVGLQI
jgi:hypothetical protein